MRQLILLRHADPEDANGRRDFDRPLTARGREDAARMGAWLAAEGLRPDHVRTSPAIRAMETAKLAAAALGLPASAVTVVGGLYDCPPAEFLRRLADLPRRGRVLVVGHNPAIEATAVHLTGDDELERHGYPRAGVLVADLPDSWDDLGARTAAHWRLASPETVGTGGRRA